jgi:DNA-binding FrmR family transcriptional regulator
LPTEDAPRNDQTRPATRPERPPQPPAASPRVAAPAPRVAAPAPRVAAPAPRVAAAAPRVAAAAPRVAAAAPAPAPAPILEPADEADLDGTFRHAYSRDRANLVRRLRRIEGQARGIERMVERGEYCVDILQQTAALRAAVDAVALLILEDHVHGCVRTAAEQGDADRYVEEVLEVVRRALGKPVKPKVQADHA